MQTARRLPSREQVFILSLLYHGFRLTKPNGYRKRTTGYIIPATKQEDASGIDFWVKMPGELDVIPVQITQRGVRMFRKYRRALDGQVEDFIEQARKRLHEKKQQCRESGVAFVLVRDYDGDKRDTVIAWGDIKALRYAIELLKRWL